MFSRSGKATENMHLPLAKVKKMYSEKPVPVVVVERRNPIQNSKPFVNFFRILNMLHSRLQKLRNILGSSSEDATRKTESTSIISLLSLSKKLKSIKSYGITRSCTWTVKMQLQLSNQSLEKRGTMCLTVRVSSGNKCRLWVTIQPSTTMSTRVNRYRECVQRHILRSKKTKYSIPNQHWKSVDESCKP